MAPLVIWFYLVCGRCRDPAYLDFWSTPRPEKPPCYTDTAIRTLCFYFDPEQKPGEVLDIDEAVKGKKLDHRYGIACLEDLCKPREEYTLASSAGSEADKRLFEMLYDQFEGAFKKDIPFCPCKLCHKELRTLGWETEDISAVHDGCSLM